MVDSCQTCNHCEMDLAQYCADGTPLIIRRKSIAGSFVGIKETQEMLDFCAENNIHPDIGLLDVNQLKEAFTRVKKNDLKYRFVLDM